jgi:hypothetical protein
MTIVVFAGPSVFGIRRDLLAGFDLRPPAECGDLARAARDGAAAIALIDGRFETTASVWHKEILWAISKGVGVYGASSLGALRAAETWPFGMVGVGMVYRLYRNGAIEDDDEVAIVHGPPELGSPPLSEAMVNMRATLRRARRRGMISAAAEGEMNEIAKSLFYKERTYDRIFALCRKRPGLAAHVDRLVVGLDSVRRDVKRDDAIALLKRLSTQPARNVAAPAFEFPATTFWEAFVAERLSGRT